MPVSDHCKPASEMNVGAKSMKLMKSSITRPGCRMPPFHIIASGRWLAKS